MKNKKRKKLKLFDMCNIALCVLLLVIFIYPFWDTLVLSVSDFAAATRRGLRIIPDFPLSFESYNKVFGQSDFWIAIRNTVARTVVGTVLTVLFTYCGGFVLAKRTLPFRKGITLYIMFTMFFSGGLIPTYFLIQDLGLMDTFWVLIIPGLTSAWNLLIARNFIMGIPEAIEEAARIDGAGVMTTMLRIFMPMSKPIIAVIALWSAIGHWNSWYDAYIYTRNKNLMVLQLLLRRILVENDRDTLGKALTQSSAMTTPETVKAATIIVAVVPIACVYPMFQKHFIKGINVGAVKG